MQPELPPLNRSGTHRPPAIRAMRAVGMVLFAAAFIGVVAADPHPGLTGDGALVTLALLAVAGGAAVALPTRLLPPGRRFAALLVIVAGSVTLIAVQGEQSSGVAGIYFASVIAASRLPKRQAVLVLVAAVGGGALAYASAGDAAEGQIASILVGVPPWFLVVRAMRDVGERRAELEHAVEDLRASREAQAAAAALAERSRLAREMHDVLAHSLSALSLQLEGTRLLAERRDTDREVVEGIERAHGLAASGLDEARRAIGALRGEALPGPDRIEAIADAFRASSQATVEVRVEGDVRMLGSEAALAVYRTAQEALTNIRRHAAATAVEVTLTYAADGVELRVADHGPGAPVAVGGGGGYGLTGMRERAELLGGRLDAGPTDDGFLVVLWLPA